MGVKYRRQYAEIINELAAAISDMDRVYDFFDMSSSEWAELEREEKLECIKTLADDVVYALGKKDNIPVGSGLVEYDKQHGLLKVYDGPRITIVSLI